MQFGPSFSGDRAFSASRIYNDRFHGLNEHLLKVVSGDEADLSSCRVISDVIRDADVDVRVVQQIMH